MLGALCKRSVSRFLAADESAETVILIVVPLAAARRLPDKRAVRVVLIVIRNAVFAAIIPFSGRPVKYIIIICDAMCAKRWSASLLERCTPWWI